MSHFRITHGKGFRIKFENGWAVSVQFGPGNYCDNYDREIGKEEAACGKEGSRTAEVAVINPKGDLIELSNGDTVDGYVTAKRVLELLVETEGRL